MKLRLRLRTQILLAGIGLALAIAPGVARSQDEPLRAGLIGLDTSHVIAFTRIFNNPEAEGDLKRIQIVAGFPGGTDIPASRDRVEGFTQQLRDMGIEIVDTIPELLERVDVVLLESVDGRPHLQQAIPVIEAGKPLFIDKPVAGSLADAIAIFEMAERHDVPCFSSSSLRFSPELQQWLAGDGREELGSIAGCATWGPCSIQSEMPDLFWYGIHGVEMLYGVMGTGCHTVTRVHTEDTDLVAGVWSEGRIGSFRGIRTNRADFGAVVFGERKIVTAGRGDYVPLCHEIARFFQTGEAPVSAAETVEMFTFMEAADESKRRGGVPVSMEEVYERALAEAQRRLEALTAAR